MTVSELKQVLSDFDDDSIVRIAGIFNADNVPVSKDSWTDYENFREIECDEFEVYFEKNRDEENVIIQFFTE